MDQFIESLVLHQKNKELEDYIKMIQRQSVEDRKDTWQQIEKVYQTKKLSKEDFLFLQTRYTLNDFCLYIEEKLTPYLKGISGERVRAGFLFYCDNVKKLYFGAGMNYPKKLQLLLAKTPPTIEMETDRHYQGDVYVVSDVTQWDKNDDPLNFQEHFIQTPVKSLISKRLKLNGVTFGTFEVYYPELKEQGFEQCIIDYICEKVQPIKEQLYFYRKEMIHHLEKNVDIQRKTISM